MAAMESEIYFDITS